MLQRYLEIIGWYGIAMAVAASVALILHPLLFRLLKHFASETRSQIDDLLVERLRKPARWLIVFLLIMVTQPYAPPELSLLVILKRAINIGVIVTLFWVLARASSAVRDGILRQYDIEAADNLKARKVYTQFNILHRIILIALFILALGSVLMTFDRVRQVGTSILASAGIAGIIIGVAAQRSVANVIAGVQIALTQPIRIDDVVIVEGEWGRIEKITLTYVVVCIWDLRRLIVPITYFVEQPFQNWTRVSADVLGSAFIYADHTLPVAKVREELDRILEGSARWDHRVSVLQVTDVTEKTIQLRALMSARDASTAWDLRCEVREKLIAFLQEHYPQCLPKVRVTPDTLVRLDDQQAKNATEES